MTRMWKRVYYCKLSRISLVQCMHNQIIIKELKLILKALMQLISIAFSFNNFKNIFVHPVNYLMRWMHGYEIMN